MGTGGKRRACCRVRISSHIITLFSFGAGGEEEGKRKSDGMGKEARDTVEDQPHHHSLRAEGRRPSRRPRENVDAKSNGGPARRREPAGLAQAKLVCLPLYWKTASFAWGVCAEICPIWLRSPAIECSCSARVSCILAKRWTQERKFRLSSRKSIRAAPTGIKVSWETHHTVGGSALSALLGGKLRQNVR